MVVKIYSIFFIFSILHNIISNIYIFTTKNDVVTIYCSIKSKNIQTFLELAKNDETIKLKQLIDNYAAYKLDKSNKIHIDYILLSHYSNLRIWLRVFDTNDISTISTIYENSKWFEREIWDMFGIYFNNHIDLRRILTDYGFNGHPLKKGFPLSGYVEIKYNEIEKQVIIEPLKLTQQYRKYEFINPWGEIPINETN